MKKKLGSTVFETLSAVDITSLNSKTIQKSKENVTKDKGVADGRPPTHQVQSLYDSHSQSISVSRQEEKERRRSMADKEKAERKSQGQEDTEMGKLRSSYSRNPEASRKSLGQDPEEEEADRDRERKGSLKSPSGKKLSSRKMRRSQADPEKDPSGVSPTTSSIDEPLNSAEPVKLPSLQNAVCSR